MTKRRMYLETMEEVLKGMPKIVMEKGGQVSVLPLVMPTPKAPSAPTPAASAVAAQPVTR